MDRAHLLVSLHKELIGPRDGANEVMPATQNPRDEYLCGVLEPVSAPIDPTNIEAEADDIAQDGEDGGDDDQEDIGRLASTSILSPALDPKALPRSIGLSFVVTASDIDPTFEVCATWGRYRQRDSGEWERSPHYHLTGPLTPTGSQSFTTSDGACILIRCIPVSGRAWRVSVFLINQTGISSDSWIEVHELIFQPQIRILCNEPTHLLPVGQKETQLSVLADPTVASPMDRSLEFQYRHRAALARGLLCGATWREIDPARPYPGHIAISDPPFSWADEQAVPSISGSRFSVPDARTDLLPIYPVQAPDMDWDSALGSPPELDPERISELWNGDDIRSALSPLINEYSEWISRCLLNTDELSNDARDIARDNLEQCLEALDRIRNGLDIICRDDEARLAFCFANKAIALQASWKGQSLRWRPFQLAFILLNIPALTNPTSQERDICDLLWFPTGGGKTEAYLGLTAFTLALRRRKGLTGDPNHPLFGGGTAVISRYTLRLLTIQQFRRAIGVIVACEYLRVMGLDTTTGPVGWRPTNCSINDTFLWGGFRFSAGLWVGGSVTPNRLNSVGPLPNPSGGRFVFLAQAIDILQGASNHYVGPNRRLRNALQAARLDKVGDPAQITSCPCCGTTLAIPDEGLTAGDHILHFAIRATRPNSPAPASLSAPGLPITTTSVTLTRNSGLQTLSLAIVVNPDSTFSSRQIEEWWYSTVAPSISNDARLICASPLRPGYFITTFDNSENDAHQSDFEVLCPSLDCELNQHAWAEQVPLRRNSPAPQNGGGLIAGSLPATSYSAPLPSVPAMAWEEVLKDFKHGSDFVSGRIPISALTVDEQIYHRVPSLLIATVDKFARLPYEPKAAALFGNVDHYHSRWGYYREGCPPTGTLALPQTFRAHPTGAVGRRQLHVPVAGFRQPDLILQDELHLIEGPLGSMVGLYETAIDILCQTGSGAIRVKPKYVASSATVREAGPQVEALFNRRLAQFPPSAISSDDRFFAREKEIHPLDSVRAGRIYVGVCAPGRGAQTPIVRIWSSLLQTGWERWQSNPSSQTDQFFSLVGYFNAIRELAGALALFRQDIPERMAFRWANNARPIGDEGLELSSRTNSLDLPSLLQRLDSPAPNTPEAVFATSMFGTGVDVSRLGLMVVHGQPKTTASYIQAAGRVGRRAGGLVVTFFRASRPRDLDHYEFFTHYHRALNRYVEPVTVAPFSPRARERALGPIAVALLRHAKRINGQQVHKDWRIQERLMGGIHSQAIRMGTHRTDNEVTAIPSAFELRAQTQPDGRRPQTGITDIEARSELDRWAAIARRHNGHDSFVYYEYGFLRVPHRDVVLGDPQHFAQNLDQAFENTPQSLRDVEETTGFKTGRR